MPLALAGSLIAVQICYPADLPLTLRKMAHFCIGNIICDDYIDLWLITGLKKTCANYIIFAQVFIINDRLIVKG
jgi:hypothetical protein